MRQKTPIEVLSSLSIQRLGGMHLSEGVDKVKKGQLKS
jgi:hypothetical protein